MYGGMCLGVGVLFLLGMTRPKAWLVPALRKLYAKFRIETVTATRRINSRVDGRGSIAEIVVLSY